MAYKFTMIFNVPGGGFSETWYYNVNGLNLPVGQGSDFDTLYAARYGMCGAQTVAAGWRLTDLSNPRLTQLRLYPGGTNTEEASDTPTNAWLAIAKSSNSPAKRQVWLRGIDDDAIMWNAKKNYWTYDGTFKSAYDSYVQLLTGTRKGVKPGASLWCIQHILSKKEMPGLVFNVTGITPSAVNNSVVLTCGNNLDLTMPIIVSGLKKPLAFLNGTYLPQSGYTATGLAVTLLHKNCTVPQAAGFPGGAVVRNRTTLLQSVASLDLEFARERKVGRAFFELRGRRRAQ